MANPSKMWRFSNPGDRQIMNAITRALILILLLISIVTGDTTCLADQNWNACVEAWKTRQSKTKKVRVVSKVDLRLEVGSQVGKDLRGADELGRPFPNEPLNLTTTFRFYVDGAQWLSERIGPDWYNSLERVVDLEHITVSSTAAFRQFKGVKGAVNGPSLGWISVNKGNNQDSSYPLFAPVMALYRPLSPGYGHFDPDQ